MFRVVQAVGFSGRPLGEAGSMHALVPQVARSKGCEVQIEEELRKLIVAGRCGVGPFT